MSHVNEMKNLKILNCHPRQYGNRKGKKTGKMFEVDCIPLVRV